MIQILISSVNRTADVKLSDFGIEQVLGHEQDSCSFTLKSGARPIEGQEVVVTSSGTRIFGGIIATPAEDEKTPTLVWHKVDAVDYGYQLDRLLVAEVYENVAAEVIVKDIMDKYCTGFTYVGVVSGAPVVEYIKFDYIRPSECFKQLAEYVGWNWRMDYHKDVHFFPQFEAAAPIIIDSNAAIRKLKHVPDIQGLRNKVYVLGGKMLSDPQDFPTVSDGVQRLWTLGHQPHSPRVIVGDISNPEIVPGLEYVDDEASYTWMYNQTEKYIRLSASTAVPADGTTVTFRYKVPMDVITIREDLASQQAIAAIQGGTGVYEHKIVDTNLITIQAAEAAGDADLAENANPRIKGSFETEVAGFAPGQRLTIDLPARGITGEYMVQRVGISHDGKRLAYEVQYSGRLKGIPDLLRALVSAQQQPTTEVKYLSKFADGLEYVGVLDDATVTPRTTPWYFGDVDAIVGEIVCLEVP